MISEERMRELIVIKNKQRAAMKAEYMKQITNPHIHATGEGGAPIDAGIQRWMAMEATRLDFIKPTFRNAMIAFMTYVVPVAVTAYLIKSERDEREALYRSGKVSYQDRKYKFI